MYAITSKIQDIQVWFNNLHPWQRSMYIIIAIGLAMLIAYAFMTKDD